MPGAIILAVPPRPRQGVYLRRPSRLLRDMATVDHVLLTRFNLPSIGRESVIRAQDGWLRERIELFLRYTVPSVEAQTAPVRWLVYLDPASPGWLLERIGPAVARGVFTPVFRESVSTAQITADARGLTGARREILLTTNLDNDDAIARDFAERLQSLAVAGRRRALYLADGLIRRGDEVYLRRDRDNAFVSVAEPWEGAVTAWCDWHNRLHRQMTVASVPGAPGWIQVVHGRNVSNRVRGRLADPARYTALFPGLLDDAPAVDPARVLADAWVRRPLRESRETVRRAAKELVLAAVGKDGLDRIKNALPVGR